MTDFVSRLVAAVQQVRRQVAHSLRCDFLKAPSVWAVIGRERDAKPEWVVVGCSCDWQQRFDARLAACVEAAILGYVPVVDNEGMCSHEMSDAAEEREQKRQEAGLAAFLAAAAQKETT